MTTEFIYTILAVDDARDTLMLLDFDLTEHGYKVITVDSGEKAFLKLSEDNIDLILLDIYMPELSGLATLAKIRTFDKYDNIPVIMLSASDDEDEIVNALDLGATDYVTKPYITKVLLARIRTAIRLKEKNNELEVLAKTDHLTGLSNRKSFYEYAKKAILQSNRSSDYPVVIAMFDIDYFKNVNDTYGHDAGDYVLKSFADLIRVNFREYDLVSRVGGEEFAVCLPNTTIGEAMLACNRLREQVVLFDFPISSDRTKLINITTSAGVASNQGELLTLEELMKIADEGLYKAKDEGRNKVINNSNSKNEAEEINIISQEKFSGIDLKIGLKNVLDDPNLFNEILIMFSQDHSNDGDKLKVAISSGDIAAAKHLAHTLKGVSSSIGAIRLFEKTKVLDEAINSDETDDVLMNHFNLVEVQLNIVLEGIKSELGDML